MTKERFWVVGGDYSCMGFRELKPGSQQMIGPFEDRDQARRVWKQVSTEHSSRATARFSIASEQVFLPN